MSKLKTNTIRHVDGSNDNITLDSSQNVTAENNLTVDGNLTVSGTTTISGYHPTTSRSNKNLMFNGAMQVAQRGTSQTSVEGIQGYTTVDRFSLAWSGANNIIEAHQRALTSSDTGPWAKGFRYAYKLVNGNQSSADAGDFVQIVQSLEAQDIACSGWDYTSTSSYITYSFWVKSSKAQNFYGSFESVDGTTKRYIYETGSLTANTWTKVTKTIPGASGLQFDLNAERGLTIYLFPFIGTNLTASNTLNTWANSTGTNYANNTSSDWWLENDATFEITGVQLEVGNVATDFEHISYGDELARCQRYYEGVYMTDGTASFKGYASYGSNANFEYQFAVHKRARPTWSLEGNASWAGATPNAYESTSSCMFQVNDGTLFSLGDSADDLCGSFSCEL